jgi:hypothetical protein
MVRAVHLRVLPATRGECKDGPRPCPLVSCRFHLLLDVSKDGRLCRTIPFDENAPESILEALSAMRETCALDVADQGGIFEWELAQLLNLRHTQLADIEARAQRKVKESGIGIEFDEHPDDPYLRHMYPKGNG